jgi:hypothetical protein
MSEAMQVVIGALLVGAALVAVRYVVTWRYKRAVEFIIRDLESQGAFEPGRAVDLPYTRQSLLRIGIRNYYVPAMQELMSEGIVGQSEAGMYYLLVRPAANPPLSRPTGRG